MPNPSSSYLLNRHHPCKKSENKLPYTANATYVSLNLEALSGSRSKFGGHLGPVPGVPLGFEREKTRVLNRVQ